jgi:hypothetical protein
VLRARSGRQADVRLKRRDEMREIGMTYGLADANMAADGAKRQMRRVLSLIFKAAE